MYSTQTREVYTTSLNNNIYHTPTENMFIAAAFQTYIRTVIPQGNPSRLFRGTPFMGGGARGSFVPNEP